MLGLQLAVHEMAEMMGMAVPQVSLAFGLHALLWSASTVLLLPVIVACAFWLDPDQVLCSFCTEPQK